MIIKTDSKTNFRKLPALLVVGALAAAPLLDPVAAQAQSAQFTLNGVVTRDLPGNEFNFRTDDGRTFRVVTRNGEPNWLSANDRVQVQGWRDGDLLVAQSLRALNDNTEKPGSGVGNSGVNNRLTLTGVVTQDLNGNQFYFRTDDGRTFRVAMRNAQPAWLSSGDRIQVRGWRDSRETDVLVAESVQPLNNSSNQNGVLTLTGVVTQNLAGNDFYLRTDDNRNFRVRSTRNAEPNWLRVGNRIEVRGRRDTSEPDVFYADRLRLISQQGGSSVGQGQNIDFNGAVLKVHSPTRLDVRGDNGRVYNVSTTSRLAPTVSVGDRMRVI